MASVEALIKSYIPMSESSFLLLSSLIEPTHGYGIMQTVDSMTGGRVSPGAGTVYTILYKMEGDGLIETVAEVDRRKVYRITETGLQVLQAERDRIRQLYGIVQWQEENLLPAAAVK